MKKEVFRMSENENNQYRLLSPWAYVGYGILFTLPVIGVSIMDGFSSYQYNYRY